jgi:plasmid stabilization system protein ParE
MAEIIWSKYALEDIENIYNYIFRESPFYAQKTIEEFFIRVEVLSMYPEIGREVPEYIKSDIRELIEGNYRIIYKIRRKSIFIVRVHHAAKNIRRKKQ